MGNPQKMTVTYTLTVKPDQVPDGKTIRCWLPYPRTDVARQKNVKLFSVSQNNYQIAPNSCAHKTIYMEQKATKGKPAKFQIVFSYECYPEFHNLEHQTIAPLTDTLLISDFLKERKPHIVFSDAIKQLSAQIVGTETNPYQKQKNIYMDSCQLSMGKCTRIFHYSQYSRIRNCQSPWRLRSSVAAANYTLSLQRHSRALAKWFYDAPGKQKLARLG